MRLDYIYNLTLTTPAFIVETNGLIFVASFGVLGRSDGITLLNQNGTKFINSTQSVGIGKVTWPNSISVIGDDYVVPGKYKLVWFLIILGGFLVPFKNGHISALSTKDLYNKSAHWKEYIKPTGNGFFHNVQELNGQMVTCLGFKSVFGSSGGYLYMFLFPFLML